VLLTLIENSTHHEEDWAMENQTLAAPRNLSIALSKQQAAELLGVSLRTIDRLISLKSLSVRRLGRRVLIPRSSV
jgi:excisionase family DNA binding protein